MTLDEVGSSSRLEAEATALFGTMRDATPEEQEGVNDYIKSIGWIEEINKSVYAKK